MPALSELLFRWERSEQLGLRFVCQSGVDAHRMHADPGGAGGETNVVVQQCLAVREIAYNSKRFGLTCTHTIVPGMAIEAVQGRHVDQISPEAPNEAKKAIAKFLNEYTFQKNGPLKLHFREEVGQDGAAQGHPAMIELHAKNMPKKRRGSIATAVTLGLLKDSKSQELHEINRSQATLRRLSVSSSERKPSIDGSTTGSAVGAPAAPGGEPVGIVRYLVTATATVRTGPDGDSAKLGEHVRGTVVEVAQESVSADGLQVVQTITPPPGATQGGWMKTFTSKGKQLLERIGVADDPPPAASRGGRRGSVSSNSSVEPPTAPSRGGRRGSVSLSGSQPGSRRGSATSGLSGGEPAEAPLTGTHVFKLKLDDSKKGKTNVELTIKEESLVLKHAKSGDQLHNLRFSKLRAHNPARVVTGGVVLGLPEGKVGPRNTAQPVVVSPGAQAVAILTCCAQDVYLLAAPATATQISELVHRRKVRMDERLAEAEREAQREREQGRERAAETGSSDGDDGSDEQEEEDEQAEEQQPPRRRKAARAYKDASQGHDGFRKGDIVDVESEDGWERNAKIIGPSRSARPDEMRVRFADGVVDDWPVADFRRP